MWSVLASPLVLGSDLFTIEKEHPDCLALLTNKDIIKVSDNTHQTSPDPLPS